MFMGGIWPCAFGLLLGAASANAATEMIPVGHQSQICALLPVAFPEPGVLTADVGGRLVLTALSGKSLWDIVIPQTTASSYCSLATDGRRRVAVAFDGFAVCWLSLVSGQDAYCENVPGAEHNYKPMDFADDGDTLAIAIGDTGRIVLMDLTRHPAARMDLNGYHANAFDIGFSQGGALLYVLSSLGMTVWNLDDAIIIRHFAAPRVSPFDSIPKIRTALFSRDLSYAAFVTLGRENDFVVTMDNKTGTIGGSFPLTGAGLTLAWSTDQLSLKVFEASGEWIAYDLIFDRIFEKAVDPGFIPHFPQWPAYIPYPMAFNADASRFFMATRDGNVLTRIVAPP